MTRGPRILALVAALAVPLAAARAASLSIVKTSTVVADQVNTLNPRALPGATIDYAITVTNPLGNGLVPVQLVSNVAIVDAIPAGVRLRVADRGAPGSGPIEFADGSLLGTGVLSSGVTYTYAGLASQSDGVDFSSDGVTWSYVPVADADGYDGNVRAIRVRVTGTQTAGAAFRLRFRVRIS